MPLIFVPTPLGNLRDITLRALDVLQACDLVVAEDTRVALRLLSALGIGSKPIWSYREQNAASVTPGILERAASETVAVVTDAGMPAISDPGRDLVNAARAAGVAIEVLPGPVAFVCAAVLSGYDLLGFSFEGFVPRKPSERDKRLREACSSRRTSTWYESPRRIAATLAALADIAPEARIFVGRELTKLHEEHLEGTPSGVLAQLPSEPRGEFVFAIRRSESIAESVHAAFAEADIDELIDEALARGESVPSIARDLAARGFGSRNGLYARASERRKRPPVQ